MYKLKKLDRPVSGAGAPTVGSRFAYLAAVEDLISFPDTDANNVLLQGQPVFKENTGLIPVYITTSSREYSYESQGEEDARSHKVKFMGSHPGTELEALEFSQNNLDKDFIIFIPGCLSSDPVRVLGRPCAPLKFKSSHKSGKDGSKFDFTFEQEVGSKYIYFMYNGPLQTAEMLYSEIDFTDAVTALSEVQKVENTAITQPLVITSLNDITAKQVTFLGQESDPTKAGTISEDLTGPIMILLKGGVQWKALDGSSISFEVFETSAGTTLIERWRA
ncbi:hypothetical protein [Chryseobacterium sp. Hurlbut01]|uniref:hypothetical protein n=1 Tax=Chryseobacterium sp. Hurlbut01 TaxID=1681828 RepID=UPI00067D6CDB|nr:hypothetical protein [Chryseobacterium sp. Hurlbut01]